MPSARNKVIRPFIVKEREKTVLDGKWHAWYPIRVNVLEDLGHRRLRLG